MHVPAHRFAMKDLQGFICGFVVILFLQSASQYYRFSDAIPSKLAAIIGLIAALAIICRHLFDLLNLYHSMHTLERFSTPEKPWPFLLSIFSNLAELGVVMICYFVIVAVSPLSNTSADQWRKYLSHITDTNLSGVFQTLILLAAYAELAWFLWDVIFYFRLRLSGLRKNGDPDLLSLLQKINSMNQRFMGFNAVCCVVFFLVYFFGRHMMPRPNDETPYYMYAGLLLVYMISHVSIFRDYYSTQIDRP